MSKYAGIPRSDVHPSQTNPSAIEPYYTMSVWHVEKCRHTQVRCTPQLSKSSLMLHSHSTPCQFDLLESADIPKSHLHPLSINPSAIEPYYTMSVWHVAECKHTHVIYTIPQSTLVAQSPTIPCRFDMWKHADIPRSDVSPCSLHLVLHSPTTPCYRALLHHVSLICGRVQTYPGHICTPCQSTLVPWSPPTPCHVEACTHTEVRCIPLLIAPSTTEPYYTMSDWDVEECRHTKIRSSPSTNWNQCYRALLLHVSLTCGRMQMYPGEMYTIPLIEPSAAEFCYTMSVWYVAEYRWTQIRPFCHNTHVNGLKCFHVTTLNNW